jgi:hypothetical protein
VSPGVGWSDNLKVTIHQSSNNQWFPQIKAGWFYLNGQENYLFAKEGWQNIAIPAGISNNFPLLNTPDLRSGAVQGPLIIDGEVFRYTRVTANFSAYASGVPISYASGLLYIKIPGELVSLTGADGVDMINVPGTGFLTSRNFYYWDFINRVAWIQRSPNDPASGETLYYSYLKDYTDLYQDEILIVDSDGLLRTMFDRAVVVQVYVIGTGVVSGCTSAGNIITPGIPLAPGTKVAVRYLVDGSFCISESQSNPTSTSLSIYRSVPDNAVFRWETSQFDSSFDTETIKNSSNNYIQLNSLMTGITPGFIYLGNPRYPAETLASIEINAAPCTVSGLQREPIRIVVTAYDTGNLPLPKVPVDVWITQDSNPSIVYRPTPMDSNLLSSGNTDLSGQRHFMWASKPELLGSFTITASAMSGSGAVLMDTYPITVQKSLMFTDIVNLPKVTLYLSPNKGPNGLHDLYLYLTNQLGVPIPQNFKAAVHCNKGRLYQTTAFLASGNPNGVQDIVLAPAQNSLSGVQVLTCWYLPVDGDQITAYPVSNKDDPNPINWAFTAYSFVCTPLDVIVTG